MADYTAGAGNVQNILEHVGSDGKELLKKKKKIKGAQKPTWKNSQWLKLEQIEPQNNAVLDYNIN